jgi:hypothetical protein
MNISTNNMKKSFENSIMEMTPKNITPSKKNNVLENSTKNLLAKNISTNYVVTAGQNSPLLYYNAKKMLLFIKGNSNMDDPGSFFGLVQDIVTTHLEKHDRLFVHIMIDRIISSSVKGFFNIFQTLNQSHQKGNNIWVGWYSKNNNTEMLQIGIDVHSLYNFKFSEIKMP